MILKTHCKFNISITILFLVTDTAKTALFCSSFTPPLYYSQQKKNLFNLMIVASAKSSIILLIEKNYTKILSTA